MSVKYILLTLLVSVLFFSMQPSTTKAQDGSYPDEWLISYTPEELEAVETALWSANLTLEDLNFRKDMTEGYQCFPIVRDMLHYPITIAPYMDSLVAGFAEWENELNSPLSEVAECLEYYPDIDASDAIENRARDMLGSFMVVGHPLSPDQLINFFQSNLMYPIELPYPEDEIGILREYAPYNMSWHDVFNPTVPEETKTEWDEIMENADDDYIYKLMEMTDYEQLAELYFALCPDPRGFIDELGEDFFPVNGPMVIETEYGTVALGTYGDDIFIGDYDVLIDPGGNDYYVDCRLGAAYGTDNRRYGYFVDLGGDDVYDCGNVNINFGSAVMGVAAFYDLGQGNDRYITGSACLGAAVCGIGTFYDDGGTDLYQSKVYSQGAAGFGIGVMVDDSVQALPFQPTDEETPDPIDIASFDNDRYSAWTNSQAFARTMGFAVCSNTRGNEIYEAGGVYLHAPLFSDRYQSFSQGFAIGERGIDYAGGIALIVDYSGNDHYLGDIYNQGVGYWYSAGLMYDGAGNDTYEMTQYGQGSGIHLAIGGLIDVDGHDSYTMHSGLGQGSSHDYAASVMMDRGGSDRYLGNTSCNGASLTNSACIFIDRSGNDIYAGKRSGSINFGRPERGFISIGIFIDMEGDDDYLGFMDNGVQWQHTDVGVGIDLTAPVAENAPKITSGPTGPGAEVEIPEIAYYEGELSQEVFDEMWAIVTRWEVGDNQVIMPVVRERIIAFGPEVLPYIAGKVDDAAGSLEYRAFSMLLTSFMDIDPDGVREILRENLESDIQMRNRVALGVTGELKLTELEDDVAAILDNEDEAMQRRAISTLGSINSHVADARLYGYLENPDEAMVKASVEALFALDVYCFDEISPLLSHPYISVRETLINLIAGKMDMYEPDLRAVILEFASRVQGGNGDEIPIPYRAIRSILKVYAKAEYYPDEELSGAVLAMMESDDWAIRADAVRIVNHWNEIARKALDTSADPSYAMVLVDYAEWVDSEMRRILVREENPYVLFELNRED